jgi:hypothetical protein
MVGRATIDGCTKLMDAMMPSRTARTATYGGDVPPEGHPHLLQQATTTYMGLACLPYCTRTPARATRTPPTCTRSTPASWTVDVETGKTTVLTLPTTVADVRQVGNSWRWTARPTAD